MDADHRDLDDVGGTPLDRRVECHPLGGPSALPPPVEVGQVAAAAVDRGGVLVATSRVDDVVEVVANPAEAGEVGLHLLLRLVAADAELGGQPEGRQPAGQTVRHGLDAVTHLGGDLVDRHAEGTGSDEVVQVLTGVERFDQAVVPERWAMMRISIWL